MTNPAPSTVQATITGRAGSLSVLASAPAAYTAPVISGPSANARRRAACPVRSRLLAVVTVGWSLILDHIPEPLVRTRILDPLHLRGVRYPVDGMCLPGELTHPGDSCGDLPQMSGN